VRERNARDEERPGGEDKVGAHHRDDGRGEPECPVRCPWIDNREQKTGEGGGEGAAAFRETRRVSLSRYAAKAVELYVLTRNTTGTRAAMNPTNTLHTIPETNIGRRRMTTNIGVYRS
jgi:hypothetical protein